MPIPYSFNRESVLRIRRAVRLVERNRLQIDSVDRYRARGDRRLVRVKLTGISGVVIANQKWIYEAEGPTEWDRDEFTFAVQMIPNPESGSGPSEIPRRVWKAAGSGETGGDLIFSPLEDTPVADLEGFTTNSPIASFTRQPLNEGTVVDIELVSAGKIIETDTPSETPAETPEVQREPNHWIIRNIVGAPANPVDVQCL